MDFLDRYPRIVFPEPNTGCWLCVRSNNKEGYARLRVGRRLIGAHRISYQMSCGAIPAGMEIDHLCSVSCCVNPVHLEAVTQRVNKSRAARRTEAKNGFRCPNGHPRSQENVYVSPTGRRACRDCAQAARDRYNEKLKIGAN